MEEFFAQLKNFWGLVALWFGLLVRTETSNAVLKSRLDTLRDQHHADMASIASMHAEIRADIKTLLQRKD